MIVLNNNSVLINIALAGAIATNQLQIDVGYDDSEAGVDIAGMQEAVTSDATPVTICDSPLNDVVRQVKYISVVNKDTAASTVHIYKYDGITTTTLCLITLSAGYQLTYTHAEGWRVINDLGAVTTTLTGFGSGTVTSIATAGLISGGTITTTGTITTSMPTNRLVGRGTASTGVMESIALGTGLSLSGTTLNVSGFASSTLTNTHIFVGNGSNVATDVAMSGEATLANTGAVTLTNSAVIGKVLTGYVSGAGTVSATDTILQAIQKLNGNTVLISTPTLNTVLGNGNVTGLNDIILSDDGSGITSQAIRGDAGIGASNSYIQFNTQDIFFYVNGNAAFGIQDGVAGATGAFTVGGLSYLAGSAKLGTSTLSTGYIEFANASNANSLTFKSGATANDITYILPVTDPTANQVLKASAVVAGVSTLSWTTAASGTVTSVTGTANRITSSGGATPVIDIAATYVGQTSITTLGTVTTGTLSTGAVVAGVTMTLGSDATGDVYYRNSGGVLTRLAIGSTGNVLTVAGGLPSWAAPATSGTVTSVSFTGGLISVATATTTPALTVAGTSGGGVYFSSTSTWASTALLAANAIMIGGGAGAAYATTTTGTGVLTALGVNVGSAGAFVTFNGALGTPSSGTATNLTGLPISTGLTGGATNRVPYFTSATALSTSSTFLFDGTNLGIGATPQSVLTVAGQSTIVAPVSGSTAQFVGVDAAPLRITFDTHNNASASGTALMGRRSRGTAGTPLALAANDVIFSINGRGYGTTQYAAASTGLLTINANQTFTDTNNGTYVSISTTPDNSVTAAEALRITGAGVVNAINASGKYQINSTDVLSGTTLGSGVLNSSLTSVGTLTGGATGAGFTVALTTSTVTGTLTVPNGGTGNTSTTAYAVQCGGTTSTGAFQAVSGVGTSGQVLTSNGAGALPTWQAAAGAGANTALSNLASVSINTSLLAQTGVDLGGTSNPFRNLYLFGAGTYGTTYLKLTGTPTSTRTLTIPDVTDTFAVLGTAQTFTANQIFTTTVTTGTGATSGHQITANSLTTGNGVEISSSSLTTGNLVALASTSTAAGSNTQTVLNIATSGANGTTTQSTWGLDIANTHTGTSSTNIAQRLSASGGTNNYALIVSAGNVGILNSTPTSALHLNKNQNSVTQADANGILLENSTAATVGLQSISPGMLWVAKGWKTNATAGSQDVRWLVDLLPVQGAASPSSTFQLKSNINSAGYTTPYTFANYGSFNVLNDALVNNFNYVSSLSGFSNPYTAFAAIPTSIGFFGSVATTNGGMAAAGFATNGGSSFPLLFDGYWTTTSAGSSLAAVVFRSFVNNGSNVRTAIAAAELAFQFRNNSTVLMTGDGGGNVAIGTHTTISAALHVIKTTEQQRLGYDTSNYFSTTVSSAGAVTFNAVGAGSTFIFSDGIATPYVAKTANYTATSSDYTIDCTSGTFNITLPTAVGCAGRIYVVKNSGAGTITLNTTSSQTIDGVTTKTLSVQYTGYAVTSDNAGWKIISAF